MSYWMSIEVFDGPFAARNWADTHIDTLIESAISYGAIDWELLPTAWGVAFEVAFKSESDWNAFRECDVVDRAISHVPNTRNILIYRGRSLDGGLSSPRKPKPKVGAGGAMLPVPETLRDWADSWTALDALFSSDRIDRRQLTSSR